MRTYSQSVRVKRVFVLALLAGCTNDEVCMIEQATARFVADHDAIDCGNPQRVANQVPMDSAPYERARDCMADALATSQPFVAGYLETGVEGATRRMFLGLPSANGMDVTLLYQSFDVGANDTVLLRTPCTEVRTTSNWYVIGYECIGTASEVCTPDPAHEP